MCYHTSQTKPKEKLKEALKREIVNDELYETAYHLNGFDKPYLPVISSADPSVIDLYRWRLVPGYVSNEKEFTANTLNARAEDIFTSNTYKRYWQNRALIICSGFFEPHKGGGAKNESWYIHPKDEEFLMIGAIYSVWKGQPTFTIITAPASPLLAEVHNEKKRMPLLLFGERAEAWLKKEMTQEEMTAMMLTPFESDDKLEAYRVIDGVMNSRLDTNIPAVIEPFGPPPAAPGTLF